MFKIQQNICYQAKNQENHNLNENIQSTNSNTKMSRMLELFDKYIKVRIIKLHQRAMKNSLKTSEKVPNPSKETEVIKNKNLNGNYKTEKYNHQDRKKPRWMK